MGSPKPTPTTCSKASRRKPRPRVCLREGCGRRYQPNRWNQRYCQDPECRRLLRRWQARRRQADRRKAADVKAKHAAAQRAHRSALGPRAKVSKTRRLRARMVTGQNAPCCPRLRSPRMPPAPKRVRSVIQHATVVRVAARQSSQVLDRERKWLCAAPSDGRKKRAFEYAAARVKSRHKAGRAAVNAPPPKPRK